MHNEIICRYQNQSWVYTKRLAWRCWFLFYCEGNVTYGVLLLEFVTCTDSFTGPSKLQRRGSPHLTSGSLPRCKRTHPFMGPCMVHFVIFSICFDVLFDLCMCWYKPICSSKPNNLFFLFFIFLTWMGRPNSALSSSIFYKPNLSWEKRKRKT